VVPSGTPERTPSSLFHHSCEVGTPPLELVGGEDALHVLDEFLTLGLFCRVQLFPSRAGGLQTLGEYVLYLLCLLVGQAVLDTQLLHYIEVRSWAGRPIRRRRRKMPDDPVLERQDGAAGADADAGNQNYHGNHGLHQQLAAVERPPGVQRMFRFCFAYHNRISRRGATSSMTGLLM